MVGGGLEWLVVGVVGGRMVGMLGGDVVRVLMMIE